MDEDPPLLPVAEEEPAVVVPGQAVHAAEPVGQLLTAPVASLTRSSVPAPESATSRCEAPSSSTPPGTCQVRVVPAVEDQLHLAAPVDPVDRSALAGPIARVGNVQGAPLVHGNVPERA